MEHLFIWWSKRDFAFTNDLYPKYVGRNGFIAPKLPLLFALVKEQLISRWNFSHVGYLDWPESESIHGNYCALLDDNFQMQSHCLGFERMYTGFHPQQIQQHFCSACQEAETVAVCLLFSKSKICSSNMVFWSCNLELLPCNQWLFLPPIAHPLLLLYS